MHDVQGVFLFQFQRIHLSLDVCCSTYTPSRTIYSYRFTSSLLHSASAAAAAAVAAAVVLLPRL